MPPYTDPEFQINFDTNFMSYSLIQVFFYSLTQVPGLLHSWWVDWVRWSLEMSQRAHWVYTGCTLGDYNVGNLPAKYLTLVWLQGRALSF